MLRTMSRRLIPPRSSGLRPWFSSSNSPSSGGNKKFASESELMEYLHKADKTMQKYEEARQMFKQGKFKAQQEANSRRGNQTSATMAQMSIAGAFIIAFLATPLLGKKIAQDHEFREKWIPSWYDFTVKKPEKPWTRDELHEQMIQVQTELRERAIRGEFTPEKLQELQRNLEYNPHRQGVDSSKVPEAWDRIHPGVESNESVNED